MTSMVVFTPIPFIVTFKITCIYIMNLSSKFHMSFTYCVINNTQGYPRTAIPKRIRFVRIDCR